MTADTKAGAAIIDSVVMPTDNPPLPAIHQQGQVAAQAPSGAMSMAMMAMERGATVEQLERLMALAERNQAFEAKQAFVQAMAEFKQNPPEIVKNKLVGYVSKTGELVGYRHATLGAVCDAVIAGLAAVGISHSWKPRQLDGKVGIACILTHRLGHSEETYLEAPADTSGKKNSIQAIGSSASYLERYTLLMACGLATNDQDDDGQGHKDPLPGWVGEYLAAISAADTKEALQSTWKVAAAACRRHQDRAAYGELKIAAEERAKALTGDEPPADGS